ncbi:MAG: LacI family DNA-binding transcriptional regulator [Candidatus Didemnitutus sp.]|nr:LacI family DNA-binding transcriptional regulator [Candidatus Didemnitutus sp.]
MPVTMRDVAERARVSVATVSKCLRSRGNISAATRAEVLRLAEEMGYRTHPFVSALMQTRRRKRTSGAQQPVLAYVTAFQTHDGWAKMPSPLLRLLFDGAKERAAGRGYQLSHFWLYRDGMSNQRFSEMLRARGVRGVFLTPLPRLGMQIDLKWEYFSVVAHGLSIAHPVFHRTSNDHYQSMMLALHECHRNGYRRPGFVMDGPLCQRLEHRWEAAFMIEREKLGFDTGVRSLLYQTWDADEVRRWVRREKPDVMISLLQEDQMQQLAARGLRMPEELGLVSLSVHDPESRISGIHQNARLIGRVAVDKLIDLVERNESGVPEDPITLTIEGKWHPGHTLHYLPADDRAGHHVI